MASQVSKTQIDRLGGRLRRGNITEADLRLLDEYRRSFSAAYDHVVSVLRNTLVLEPTGRPAKSTTSIVEKLRRESIRLTQIQDIAGCRLIVLGIMEQEQVVDSLRNLFDNVTTVDRREQPSHGYRAVHVIVMHEEKVVEIQVRTSLQHLWAEWSEKLSDLFNPAIKYGEGDQSLIALLLKGSDVIAGEESIELSIEEAEKKGIHYVTLANQRVISVEDWRKSQMSLKTDALQLLREAIDESPNLAGRQ